MTNKEAFSADEQYLQQIYDRKYNNEGNPVNLPSEFQKLSESDAQALMSWIKKNMKPTKTFDPKRTSYGLKHVFEKATGIYVCNGAFKGAMLASGFEPQRIEELNWSFNCRLKKQSIKTLTIEEHQKLAEELRTAREQLYSAATTISHKSTGEARKAYKACLSAMYQVGRVGGSLSCALQKEYSQSEYIDNPYLAEMGQAVQ